MQGRIDVMQAIAADDTLFAVRTQIRVDRDEIVQLYQDLDAKIYYLN